MSLPRIHSLSLILGIGLAAASFPQDRLPTMPRYDRYEKLRREIAGSVKRASVAPTWSEDGKSFSFAKDGTNYRFDLASRKMSEAVAEAVAANQPESAGRRGRRGGQGTPERGRQFDTALSPDGKLKAFHRNRNVYIANADGSGEYAVTTEGNEKDRTKYGIASWVYGEELGVREAMWWSPDGKMLAYYGFDESKVKDFFLAMNVTQIQNALDVEAYPKAGADNPGVSLFIYHLASKEKIKIDPKFKEPELGEYVYSVRWSPRGDELLFNRTNRKQNTMELCAVEPVSGKTRVVLRESNPNGWVDNAPRIQWLSDNERFLWFSERNGFQNIYLADLKGSIKPLTQHKFEVSSVVKVDQKAGRLWYMARDGENYYRHQLHRVGLDGKGEKRLTDPKFHHSVQISPDGKYIIDTAETIDTPPVVRLLDAEGAVLQTLAESDEAKFKELRLQKVERFQCKAADGVTDIYGWLAKPSDFDPSQKYPIILGTYGGPESGGGADRFATPDPATELGFLVAWVDIRGTSGRGQAFKDAVYGKLGVVEIDDHAAAIKYLRERPYVDGNRVGVHGSSYGGYVTVMAMLRHPDVFRAGVASSSVTDWRNYDTIYTERYMGLPWENENKAGYDTGSAMTYAKNLKGKLLLFYGTADNNVHATNTYQLAKALQQAGKSFYMMAGPDMGHTGVNNNYMWEFFIDHLMLNSSSKNPLESQWRARKLSARSAAAKSR